MLYFNFLIISMALFSYKVLISNSNYIVLIFMLFNFRIYYKLANPKIKQRIFVKTR